MTWNLTFDQSEGPQSYHPQSAVKTKLIVVSKYFVGLSKYNSYWCLDSKYKREEEFIHLQVTTKSPRVSEERCKGVAEKSVKGSEDGEGGGGGWRRDIGGSAGGEGGIGGVRVPRGIPSRHGVPIRTQPANHQYHLCLAAVLLQPTWRESWDYEGLYRLQELQMLECQPASLSLFPPSTDCLC